MLDNGYITEIKLDSILYYDITEKRTEFISFTNGKSYKIIMAILPIAASIANIVMQILQMN